MATVANIISLVRAETSQDVAGQITDAHLIAWIDLDYQTVRRMVSDEVPNPWLKLKTFALSSNSQDLTASPASLTDFERIFRLELLEGSAYSALDVASAIDPELSRAPSYLERGTSIDLFPTTNSLSGKTLKLTYVAKPTTLDSTDDVLDLPAGFEAVVVERVAARVRRRQFESDIDPNNVGLEALKGMIESLKKRYRAVNPVGFVRRGR